MKRISGTDRERTFPIDVDRGSTQHTSRQSSSPIGKQERPKYRGSGPDSGYGNRRLGPSDYHDEKINHMGSSGSGNRQQQTGDRRRERGGMNSSQLTVESESSDAIFQIGCTSPTAWICDIGPMFGPNGFFSPKKQTSINNYFDDADDRECAPDIKENNQSWLDRVSSSRDGRERRNSNPSSKSNKQTPTHGITNFNNNERFHALNELTQESSSDDEARFLKKKSTGGRKHRPRSISPESTVSSITSTRTDNISPTDESSEQLLKRRENKTVPISSPLVTEPRIVAPNVEKLSPSSQVEVYLQSHNDCVIVLCSVDVLKMRSEFFCEVLGDQDRAKPINSSIGMTRDPIMLQETSPFDAAALLEALHESRSGLKGEWSFSWARLSIQWLIEDFIAEYAMQIENHFYNIFNVIQSNHWRNNPQILSGWKVAIFRKSTAIHPSFMTGTIVDPISSTSNSRVRVAFDSISSSNAGGQSLSNLTANIVSTKQASTPNYSSSAAQQIASLDDLGVQNLGPHPQSLSAAPMTLAQQNLNQISGGSGNGYANKDPTQPFVGDIGEPFWVLNIKKEGSYWTDPDDIFLNEAKKFVKPR
jgi:hypothetical protein